MYSSVYQVDLSSRVPKTTNTSRKRTSQNKKTYTQLDHFFTVVCLVGRNVGVRRWYTYTALEENLHARFGYNVVTENPQLAKCIVSFDFANPSCVQAKMRTTAKKPRWKQEKNTGRSSTIWPLLLCSDHNIRDSVTPFEWNSRMKIKTKA